MNTAVINFAKFDHDCSDCIFLGHTLNADLYVCVGGNTVIARMSSYEPDYISGASLATHDARLAAALGLAASRGIFLKNNS